MIFLLPLPYPVIHTAKSGYSYAGIACTILDDTIPNAGIKEESDHHIGADYLSIGDYYYYLGPADAPYV